MSGSMCYSHIKPMKLLAGTAVAALLIGWAAGVGAQTTDPSLPPQQASLPASNSTANPPSLPLGHDDVREVQNQLIALGFDPGPADGQVGPATIAAAQQYDQNRGGSGEVPIDAALLARLKAGHRPALDLRPGRREVAGAQPGANVVGGTRVEPVRQRRAANRTAPGSRDQQQQQQWRLWAQLLRSRSRILRSRSRILRSGPRLLRARLRLRLLGRAHWCLPISPTLSRCSRRSRSRALSATDAAFIGARHWSGALR